MFSISPGVLGFARTVLSVALWSAAMAVLSYLSDATHLNGLVNGSLAILIAGGAGVIEHQMETKGSGALFGAVRCV